MRTLRRNTVLFTYRPYEGKAYRENSDGRKTGTLNPVYGPGTTCRGNLAPATGFAANNWFGVNTRYTHIVLMDDSTADIRETGRIDYGGAEYEITAVRKSVNVLALALRRLTGSEGQA